MSAPPPPARWRRLRRAAPYLIAGATLAALLVRYPVARIAAEMERGDLLAMAPPALAAILALWVTSTSADFLVLRALVPGLRWRRLARGKAGVSVLNALGPALNYGGHGLWIQRCFRVGAGAAAGVVLFITAGDLFSATSVAAASIALGGAAVPRGLAIGAPIAAAAALAILAIRPAAVRRGVFHAWRDVPYRDRAAGLACRWGNLAVLVLATWAGARGFGIPLPLAAVASYLPVLLVVAALPVNVAGMGPVQAAWIGAFSGYAPAEQILAFQFLWHLCLLVALLLRGAPFLRAAVADVTSADRAAEE